MGKTFYIISSAEDTRVSWLKIARLEAGFVFSSGGIVLLHRPPEKTK